MPDATYTLFFTHATNGHRLKITIIDKDGDAHVLDAKAGDNILALCQTHDIEMEGACEGSCCCSTCHVIVQSEAFGLTETSRLGCQVEMSKALDGIVVRLPQMTKNLQARDFAPR
jgi:ferredoxin